MAFSSTDSYVAADANNTRRGLFRDNTDNAHTGDTAATALASTTITGGTMGATGTLYVRAAGTVTGAAGSKTIKLILGTTTLYSTGVTAGAADWHIDADIHNTATGAQRVIIRASDHSSATNYDMDYVTGTEDTTGNLTLKTEVTLANAGDTVTNTMFTVEVQQIT